MEQAVAKLTSALEGSIQDPHHWGLIHADMRSTNLLYGRGGATLIDFDDCGNSWYLYDLAAALSFYEHDPEIELWIDSWLNGYQRHQSLTSDDHRRIWPLIVYRRLVLLGWTLSHSATSTASHLGSDFQLQTVELCDRYCKMSN
jgi:Ser/Thr protein kinase RdoA (MazF antagonist)